MALGSIHHCPKVFLIPKIPFFRYRYVAFIWKNFEFLSPWTAHKDREPQNHIFISLSNRSLTTLFSIWAWKLIPVLRATSLAYASNFCLCCSSFWTQPKCLLLQFFKATPQSSILDTIPEAWLVALLFPHTALTVCAQPLSVSHISLNLNSLLGITESTGFQNPQARVWSARVSGLTYYNLDGAVLTFQLWITTCYWLSFYLASLKLNCHLWKIFSK